jgi:predicted SAM-dependent methyltransferase
MKLNIGAGNRHLEGFLSVDIQGGDVVTNAWDLPFQDGSVEEVYSRHFIEHVTLTQAADCLREWHRVLRPGAECLVICPDRDYHLPRIGNYAQDPVTGTTHHRHAMHALYGWQKMEQCGFIGVTRVAGPEPDLCVKGLR